jgi:hypothetical protein
LKRLGLLPEGYIYPMGVTYSFDRKAPLVY